MSRKDEEEHIDPALVRSKLRVVEDHNFALRLQEEEFNRHYDQNRTERRVVGSDTKTTKTEQKKEDEFARHIRLSASRRIAETDEEVARRIAAEWEAEETRKVLEKEEQLRRDEELAKALEKETTPSTSAPTNQYSSYQPQGRHVHFNNVQPSQTHDFPVPPPSVDDLLSMANVPASYSSDNSDPILQGTYVGPTPTVTTLPTRPRGIALPGLAKPQSELPSSDIGSPISWPEPPVSAIADNRPSESNVARNTTLQPQLNGHPSSVPPTGSTVGRTAFSNNNLNFNPVGPQGVSTNPFDPSFWSADNATQVQNQPIHNIAASTVQPMSQVPAAQPHLVPMPSLPSSMVPSNNVYNGRTTSAIDSPPPAYESEFGLPPPSALALGQSGTHSGTITRKYPI